MEAASWPDLLCFITSSPPFSFEIDRVSFFADLIYGFMH